MRIPRARWLVTFGLLTGLLGCTVTRVSSEESETADFSAYRTYEWFDDMPDDRDPSAEVVREPRQIRVAQGVAGRELETHGLSEVTEGGTADLRIGLALSVREELQINDPYYAYYAEEKYELGIVTLRFLDTSTTEEVWRGTAQRRLRTTAGRIGPFGKVFSPIEQERQWDLEEMVGKIMARVPWAEDG